jgi:predicted nucleic acid-binding protein
VSAARARKYVLDTNLFIQAFRAPAANAELQRFHLLFAPFEFLSAVVAQELLAGTRTRADRRKLQRHVLDVFARRGRIVAPSARAWEQSGIVLAELVRREGLVLRRVPKAFGNDVLLAVSCREAGLVLVTDNGRDFDRIARITNFEFIEPWPAPTHG